MDEHTLQVSWDPPQTPNGVLIAYQVGVTNLINSTKTFDVVAPSVHELHITNGIRKWMCVMCGVVTVLMKFPPCCFLVMVINIGYGTLHRTLAVTGAEKKLHKQYTMACAHIIQ